MMCGTTGSSTRLRVAFLTVVGELIAYLRKPISESQIRREIERQGRSCAGRGREGRRKQEGERGGERGVGRGRGERKGRGGGEEGRGRGKEGKREGGGKGGEGGG